MAMDYAREGVRVNSVCPSMTLSNMTKEDLKKSSTKKKLRERMPLGRAAMPEDIAAVVAFLASDDARFVTGVNLPVDGGVSASNGQPAW
jgi:meso-butanediol dehydrogenase/(S,S)-butanediol dehydrogenase/diacetyl reductase